MVNHGQSALLNEGKLGTDGKHGLEPSAGFLMMTRQYLGGTTRATFYKSSITFEVICRDLLLALDIALAATKCWCLSSWLPATLTKT